MGGIFSGYANPQFDAILEDALDAPIPEKLSLTAQAQEIFAEEAPAVVLYYPDGRWGYRPGAYDGWISDPGHGVFTKRSFLAPYAAGSAAAEQPAEGTEAGEASGSEDSEQADAVSDDPASGEAADASSGTAGADPAEPAAGEDPTAAEASDEATEQPEPDTAAAAADDADAADDDDGGGAAVAVLIVVALASAVVVAVIGERRRRGRKGTVED